ncbi:hypothetical protein BDW69DRAFT_159672 [Aspergillus filifer]
MPQRVHVLIISPRCSCSSYLVNIRLTLISECKLRVIQSRINIKAKQVELRIQECIHHASEKLSIYENLVCCAVDVCLQSRWFTNTALPESGSLHPLFPGHFVDFVAQGIDYVEARALHLANVIEGERAMFEDLFVKSVNSIAEGWLCVLHPL